MRPGSCFSILLLLLTPFFLSSSLRFTANLFHFISSLLVTFTSWLVTVSLHYVSYVSSLLYFFFFTSSSFYFLGVRVMLAGFIGLWLYSSSLLFLFFYLFLFFFWVALLSCSLLHCTVTNPFPLGGLARKVVCIYHFFAGGYFGVYGFL